MGTGVAQNVAQSGYDAIVVDISQEALAKAKQELQQTIRFQGLFNKTKVSEPVDTVMQRITFTTSMDELDDVEFVIENVPEIWEAKKSVYLDLDRICRPDCIFLVNTSCIPITRIASLTRRPAFIFGVHFMNPVPLKSTVEGIRGFHTGEETIARAKQFLASLGKECIVVNDYPGFVSNRISHLFMNEAAYVVQDQVADPEEVDAIFKKCFGHKMGPLETADLIGLDTVVQSLEILYESYQDPKFRCCPLLKKMVYAGHLGKKSGKGFYAYETEEELSFI